MSLAHSERVLGYTWQPDAAAVRTDKRYHKKGFITYELAVILQQDKLFVSETAIKPRNATNYVRNSWHRTSNQPPLSLTHWLEANDYSRFLSDRDLQKG